MAKAIATTAREVAHDVARRQMVAVARRRDAHRRWAFGRGRLYRRAFRNVTHFLEDPFTAGSPCTLLPGADAAATVHGSINPSIKAANGASSLLKLATIAVSIASGCMRSSASGCPGARREQGQIAELRSSIALTKGMDGVQLGQKMRRAECKVMGGQAVQKIIGAQLPNSFRISASMCSG